MYYLKKDVLPVVYWEGLLRLVACGYMVYLCGMPSGISIGCRGLWGGPKRLRKALASLSTKAS